MNRRIVVLSQQCAELRRRLGASRSAATPDASAAPAPVASTTPVFVSGDEVTTAYGPGVVRKQRDNSGMCAVSLCWGAVVYCMPAELRLRDPLARVRCCLLVCGLLFACGPDPSAVLFRLCVVFLFSGAACAMGPPHEHICSFGFSCLVADPTPCVFPCSLDRALHTGSSSAISIRSHYALPQPLQQTQSGLHVHP